MHVTRAGGMTWECAIGCCCGWVRLSWCRFKAAALLDSFFLFNWLVWGVGVKRWKGREGRLEREGGWLYVEVLME
jgi:hypothetical protein